MDKTAQEKQTVLITDAASLFGQAIAGALLESNAIIYGCAKQQPKENILQNPNFTLIDIDLSQPLPSHLPVFDLIIHLSSERDGQHLSSNTKNLISGSRSEKTKVIICLPISAAENIIEENYLFEDFQKNKIFLIGEIYGPEIFTNKPNPESYYSQNKLTKLIFQAINQDKIILENEGLETIYPIFIEDAKRNFLKLFNQNSKKPRFIAGEAQTALSVSYEIQNSARLTLHREIGIYFIGDESQAKNFTEPIIRISENLTSKYDIQSGLKKTLEKYVDADKKNSPEEEKSQIKQEEVLKAQMLAKTEKKQFLNKKPKFFSLLKNSNTKKIILAIVVLLIFTIAKIFLDTYLGFQNIKTAKADLLKGDFANSSKKAQNSESNFKSAQLEFGLITYPLTLIIPGKLQMVSSALKSAEHASLALVYFSEGASSLSKNLSIITSEKSNSDVLNFEDPQANFSKASFEATYANQLAELAQNNLIFKNKLQNIKANLKELSQVSQISFELSSLATNITGTGETKTYLILIENNTELRPGGGFIGNYGLLNFEKGKLKSLDVDDIYNIDGQLKEKIDPPPQLAQKLGVKQLFLRDSNWSTDFNINAKTAKDFFKKETGKDVDGVIAIDLSFMQNLLEKTGSIKLNDYKEEISSQNLFDKGEYYSEIGFFPGSTQKKEFFASLSKSLLEKIISSLSNLSAEGKTDLVSVIDSAQESLQQKHILVSFDDSTVSAFIKSQKWDNQLPPLNFDVSNDSTETRDFLALSEANIGANKVNRFVKRSINYDITLGRDADLVATLNITYQNTSPADTWPAGTYVDYLRIFAPPSSGIEDFQVDGNSDLKKVEVTSDANLAVFASLLEVPVGKTKTVTVKYRIPKNIKLEKAPTYHLYIQKQPGTEKDPLRFTFNLPGYLKIDSLNESDLKSAQNYSQNLDLSQDREFSIKISKK